MGNILKRRFEKNIKKIIFFIEQNKLEKVKKKLKNTKYIYYKDDGFGCFLHIAVKKNNIAISDALLDYGLSPYIKDGNGLSSIHLACKLNHDRIVSLFLKRGLEFTTFDARNKEPPIHTTARFGSYNCFKKIIERCKDCCYDIRNDMGQNLLHVAAIGGNVNILKYCIDVLKFDINSKDITDYTPLHYAYKYSKKIIISELLSNNKINPNIKNIYNKKPIDLKNNQTLTLKK